MIPRAAITAWRRQAPWPDDALVEQDLVLSRALVEIFSHPDIAGRLAFRGGTALHKLVLESPARFSEDVDLVQVEAGPIGRTLNAVRECLGGWLGSPRTKQSHSGATMLFRFQSELEPAGQRRLKIEINTREHFALLGLDRLPFSVSSPWYEGGTEVTTYRVEELLATKLRALYQRRKGRDLFDLHLALRQLRPSEQRIVECFLEYMARGEAAVSRAVFEENVAAKASDRSFLDDVAPLLAPGVQWDLEEALRAVLRDIVSRIPGAPWKGRAGTESGSD